MRNNTALLLLIIPFLSCDFEPNKDKETLADSGPKYETYNYTGFTKEEISSFHKRIYEGGSWTEYGDLERYFYLNFSRIKEALTLYRLLSS